MFNVLIETSATICIIFGFGFLYFNHFNLDDTFLQREGVCSGERELLDQFIYKCHEKLIRKNNQS